VNFENIFEVRTFEQTKSEVRSGKLFLVLTSFVLYSFVH
jgi:hypothetical protein